MVVEEATPRDDPELRRDLGLGDDFIVLHAGSWHWPTFNVADASISIGALLLAYDLVFERKSRAGTGDQ